VLVLDEATAMLDPPARAQLVATALRLCREEGVAVLHVTHHMDEAAVADRVVALDRGGWPLTARPGSFWPTRACWPGWARTCRRWCAWPGSWPRRGCRCSPERFGWKSWWSSWAAAAGARRRPVSGERSWPLSCAIFTMCTTRERRWRRPLCGACL